MKFHLHLLAAVAFVFSIWGCKPKDGELNGTVFIVTQSRENVKLGLVTVNAYKAEDAKASIAVYVEQLRIQATNASRAARPLALEVKNQLADFKSFSGEYNVHPTTSLQAQLEAKREQINKLVRDFNALVTPVNRQLSSFEQLCYEAIRQPVASAKTDADGKFTMELPQEGEFIVAASATRKVGYRTETYCWIVPVSLTGEKKQPILLSNDNLLNTDSVHSLIPKRPFSADDFQLLELLNASIPSH